MNGKHQLDGLGKAGVILNVVVGSGEALLSVIYFFIGIILLFNRDVGYGIGLILLCLLFGSISTIALIYNARVLSGDLQYKQTACILGFVSLSILGSILLIVSQDIEVDENGKYLSTQNNKEDLADILTKYKELLDNEAITLDEYNMIKRKLLSR